MPAQRHNGGAGQGDGAPAVRGLRFDELAVLHGMVDVDQGGVQIHAGPTQAEQLALAHAGGDRHDVEGAEGIVFDAGEELARLVGGEGAHGSAARARRVGQVGDVLDDEAPARRVFQSAV